MIIEDIFGDNGVLTKKLGAYEFRPEQIDMARAIGGSINKRKHLIVEAGTGVGKSLAYLVPFIYWAVKKNTKFVVSTYTKTLQEQLISKDLPFLHKTLGLDFSFALCVGGQNYLCLRRFEQSQVHGMFSSIKEVKEFQKIHDWKMQSKHGLKSELDFEPTSATWGKVCRESDLCFGKRCVFKNDCFYNKAKRKEFKSHILVTNHHLYFANLASDGRVLPNFDAVVFDEAHTLEDIASSYFGIEVSNSRTRYLLDSIHNPKTGKGLLSRLSKDSSPHSRKDRKGEIKDSIVEALKVAMDASNLFFSEIVNKYGNGKLTVRIRESGWIVNYLDKPLDALSNLLKLMHDHIKTEEDHLEIDAFVNRCNETRNNISIIINQEHDEHVYWLEFSKRPNSQFSLLSGNKQANNPIKYYDQSAIRCSLFATPINVADEFKKQIFDKIKPVVLTSATLTTNANFDYIKERLGIEECSEKMIGSPFDYSKQALIFTPCDVPDPNMNKSEFLSKSVEYIKGILAITKGRTFVLFTSFQMLNVVYEGVKDSMDTLNLLKQGDKPRYKIIEEFKTNDKSVLFGTNTFWQGVDVPGKALECVIITKLPFAVPDDPIIEARMELLKAQNKNPFTHYQIPQAVTLLRQGFGRLIRTKTDIGIVAILDPRIRTKYYGKFFLNSLPDCKTISEINEVSDFFVNADT